MRGELIKLRRGLPEGVVVLVGGQAYVAYLDVLEKIGALVLKELADLRTHLGLLRVRQPNGPHMS